MQVHGAAYDEYDILGVAYVIEQATKLRQPASLVNPSMYRCAKTTPAPPFAARGACNPDYDAVLKVIGYDSRPLGFSLETETAQSLDPEAEQGRGLGRGAHPRLPRPHRADQRRGPGPPGRA